MRYTQIARLLLAAATPIRAAFTWENVNIGGGGGFVPNFVFHPTTSGLAYARTDIGGIYRLNSDDSWTAITDSLATDADWHDWGIDALALDPQNPDMVYAAVGMYTNSWDPNNGSIIISSDQGDTWTSVGLPFKVGGNMPGRGTGERLAVDPQNSDILYFGARSGHGLWRSTDAGLTWANVTSYTAVGTYAPDPSDTTGYESDLQGLLFVTFDSTSDTIDGATSRIFVGTADNITASVYVSEDAGETWSAVAGQPGTFFPHKGKLQPDEKALYLSYSDGTGPYDGTDGSVWRYDITNATWTEITPVSGSSLYFGFGGLGLDMLNPGTIVVAALNSWWPNGQLFRSTDSGATWSALWEWTDYPDMDLYFSLETTVAPWVDVFLVNYGLTLGWMIEGLEIDPFDSDHWLYGTGLSAFGGYDLTDWDTVHNITIEDMAGGMEETSVQQVISVVGGTELLAAVADDNGFTFASSSDLDTSPDAYWEDPVWSTASSVDYAGNSPASLVRVGDTEAATTPQVALSTDGGASWNIDYGAADSEYGGTVAYSADADTVLWSTESSGVLISQYQATFSVVLSLPSLAVIASDKSDNSYFYAGSGATFYVSSDIGVTFSAGGTLSGATDIRDIAAHPTTAGTVYVSTDAGVFVSTDSGSSFTLLGGGALTDTQKIAVGLGSSSSSWNLYAFGTGADGNKLYASADGGDTWVDIQGTQGFGAISSCALAGSGNNAGQVYVGTNGRGVFWAQGDVSGSSTTTSSSSTSASKTTTTTSTTKTTTTTTTTTTTKTTTTTTTTSTTTKTTTKTTLSTSTTTSTTTSSAPTSTSTDVAGQYYQCGGEGWTGPTVCASPYTCTYENPYYSQCL